MGRIWNAIQQGRDTRSFRNAADISTVIGFPSSLAIALGLLSRWAPGPLSFLADLDPLWYAFVVALGLVVAGTVVDKRARHRIQLAEVPLGAIRTDLADFEGRLSAVELAAPAGVHSYPAAPAALSPEIEKRIESLRIELDAVNRTMAAAGVANPNPTSQPPASKPDTLSDVRRMNQGVARNELVAALRDLLKEGLKLNRRLPVNDPDGLARAEAIASGQPSLPRAQEVAEWEARVGRLLEGAQRKSERERFQRSVPISDVPASKVELAAASVLSFSPPPSLGRRMTVRVQRLADIIQDIQAEN